MKFQSQTRLGERGVRMNESQATTSLYVRIEPETDTAMRDAIRASPSKYGSIAEFVRVAIDNQLKTERRNVGRAAQKLNNNSNSNSSTKIKN